MEYAEVIRYCAGKLVWLAGEAISNPGGNGYINVGPASGLWREALQHETGARRCAKTGNHSGIDPGFMRGAFLYSNWPGIAIRDHVMTPYVTKADTEAPAPLQPDNTVANSPAIQAFWGNFCRASGVVEDTPYRAWYFSTNAASAHALAERVLLGTKCVTTCLTWTNERYPHTAPVFGGYSVITEFDGTPRAVIRTVSISTCAFRDIDANLAAADGDDDLSLEEWRVRHWRFFADECAALERTPSKEMPITSARFELLWPRPRRHGPPQIDTGYLPGLIGAVVQLHGRYYAREVGFGVAFEARVARELAEFMERYESAPNRIWSVNADDDMHASIAIDGADASAAHLRWFIVSDALRGQGFGKILMNEALAFCRARGFGRVWLNTIAGLDASRYLYEKSGFRVVSESHGISWGKETTEQRWELLL